jgi:hypothetical protein
VLQVEPGPAPSGLLAGFTSASAVYDVTAHWAKAGTQVHQFLKPIEIVIDGAAGTIAATYDGSSWHMMKTVPSAGQLPEGWSDGAWSAGSSMHILTRHLSLFALIRDTAAPTAPLHFSGRNAGGTLALHWDPGTDNSGQIAGYTLYENGTATQSLGGGQTSTTAGAYDPADTRAFTLAESDAAGNVSPQTRPLRVVPTLVGLSTADARAALEARGFAVGKLNQVTSKSAPGTVVGPADLVLAEEGATIDLDVAGDGSGSAAKLVFSVVGTKRFSWTQRTYIGARIKTSRASSVTVTLLNGGGQRLYTWRVHVKAGVSIMKLPMPRQVRRPGRYTLVWVVTANGSSTRKTIPVQIVGSGKGLGKVLHPVSEPVEVVLTGSQIPKDLALGLDDPATRVVEAAGADAFDVTGDPRKNVQVIVVDADEYGLGLVRDLHTVFPTVRLIVLSDDPRKLAAAIHTGASLALPRSTPADKLAKVVSKLAKNPPATAFRR